MDFSVSPKELSLVGYKNEWICETIIIKPENIDISINSKWSNNRTKNIFDYNLTNDNVRVELNYSKVNNLSYNICLKSKYLLEKEGILFIRVKDKPIGIGIWINLKVIQRESIQNLLTKPDKKINFKGIITAILSMLFIELIIYLKTRTN